MMPQIKTFFPHLLVLLFSLGWLVYNQNLLLAPVDTGDGLLHFFISQASWENPHYFLDHWGKPLFTLLTSPFAQMDYDGMFLFNLFVFIGTTVFGWLILNKLNVNKGFAICFPLFLLLTNDYTRTISAGLTEPLFSFFLVFGSWLWLRSSYLSTAFVVGCLLFQRSEGQLTVLLFLPLLIYARQWKAIFVLSLPFLVYAVLGWIFLNDIFWYFTKSPYDPANSLYGSGDYLHYLMSYKNYMGNHGLFLFLASIPMIFIHFRSKKVDFKLFGLVLISFGTFFGILISHSYFWGNGTHGSMGLTRIATQALPSFLIVSLYFFSQYSFLKKMPFNFLGYILCFGMIIQLCFSPFLKKSIQPMEESIQEIYKATFPIVTTHSPLITSNIYFAELLGRNPLKKGKPSTLVLSREILVNPKYHFEKGTYILWDNYAGPIELDVQYSLISKYPGMRLQERVEINGAEVCLFHYEGD
tara:strand:- start:54369 stop:55775 length:1407 start_codon:yes stop_codon:yes gene_type:complete